MGLFYSLNTLIYNKKNLYGHFLLRAHGMNDFPIWVQLLPKVTMETTSTNFIKSFYHWPMFKSVSEQVQHQTITKTSFNMEIF